MHEMGNVTYTVFRHILCGFCRALLVTTFLIGETWAEGSRKLTNENHIKRDGPVYVAAGRSVLIKRIACSLPSTGFAAHYSVALTLPASRGDDAVVSLARRASAADCEEKSRTQPSNQNTNLVITHKQKL